MVVIFTVVFRGLAIASTIIFSKTNNTIDWVTFHTFKVHNKYDGSTLKTAAAEILKTFSNLGVGAFIIKFDDFPTSNYDQAA